MTEADLASVGRTLAANDPRPGAGTGEGEVEDRNVELLIADPRTPGPTPQDCDPEDSQDQTAPPATTTSPGTTASPTGSRAGPATTAIKAGSGDDCAGGGRGSDGSNGEEDDDRVRGGRGADRVKGGAGSDSVKGGRGSDIVVGGGDLDDLGGGIGDDRIRAADGVAEQIRCGPGTDSAIADPRGHPQGLRARHPPPLARQLSWIAVLDSRAGQLRG